MANGNKIITYKGFDKDFKCRGFQYEVGNTYETDDDIACCNRGFHACESPMEVFDYYDMLTSRFAEVEQSGKIDKEAASTKTCSSRIKIKAELKLADIINLGVEWLKEITSPSKIEANNTSNDGDSAQIGSSGDSAQIGSSGDSAQIGSSGDYAKIGSSGDSAQIGSSGHYAKIGSSGDYAQIGSSGDSAQIGSSGQDSVIMCAGHDSKAKAAIGSWITLAEWKRIEDVWKPICVKTEQVDGKRIKADAYYRLIDGKFEEVK